METKQKILSALKHAIASETGLAVSEIEDRDSFYSLGLDSVSAVFVLDNLEKQLKVEMNPMFFWDYPTVDLLAEHITSLCKNE